MLMQLQLHCRLQSMSNRGASQTKRTEAFCKPDETFVTLLTWPNSMNILVDLGLINNLQRKVKEGDDWAWAAEARLGNPS